MHSVGLTSNLALHELERGDGLAELLALVGILERHVERGLHDTEGTPREDEALVVEAAHENFGAVALTTDDVLGRHLHVVEEELGGGGAAHLGVSQCSEASD